MFFGVLRGELGYKWHNPLGGCIHQYPHISNFVLFIPQYSPALKSIKLVDKDTPFYHQLRQILQMGVP